MTNIELSLYTEEELYWAIHQKNEQKKSHNSIETDDPVESIDN